MHPPRADQDQRRDLGGNPFCRKDPRWRHHIAELERGLTAALGPALAAGLSFRPGIATRYRRCVPLSDLEVQRQAHLWLQLHRDEAVAKAREMVEAMRKKGDEAGADTWLRIIAAITSLGTPPTDARH